MVVDNLVRGAVVASIPLAHAVGQLHLWHIYAAAAVYGLLMMISLAGGPALIPSLVRRDRLPTANALEVLSFTLGSVLGAPLAGLLTAQIGAPIVLLVDALSYATFALALSSLHVTAARRPAVPAGRGQHGLDHAVRLLLGNPVLLSTTLMFMAFNIGNGLLQVWLPVLAGRMLGGNAGLYGMLLGVMAAGALISTILAGGLTPRLSLGTMICLAQALAGAALLLLLIGPSLWSALLGLTLYGALNAPLTVWAQTLRMQIIPEHLRGRAFALLRMLMQGGTPIGGAAGGLLLPVVGVPGMILASAALVSLPGMIGARLRALRQADRASPETEPAAAPDAAVGVEEAAGAR